MELRLKKSQVSLAQIQTAMSRFFDMRRVVRGRHEWVEGVLRDEPGLGKRDPEDEAMMTIDVPYDEKQKRTLVTRILSHFSDTLYRIRIQNLDLPTTRAVIREFQGLGADVGFSVQVGSLRPTTSSEGIDFPGTPEDELSRASELYGADVEVSPHREEEMETEPIPYLVCGGTPSADLCTRCKYSTLRAGEEFCEKYGIDIDLEN